MGLELITHKGQSPIPICVLLLNGGFSMGCFICAIKTQINVMLQLESD